MKNFDELVPTKGPKPKGLAPLEMVLVLPLLMMFMGVIIVFGYAASWKIRSEVVARDVGWKIRYPRSQSYPHTTKRDLEGSRIFELHERSPEWQEARDDNERLESYRSGDQNLEDYANDEVVTAPIIRGPITEVTVNDRLLDFTRGISRGVSDITRPSPVMSEFGRVNFVTPNAFMDDEFQYTRMSWTTPRGETVGTGGNWGRRIPVLWELELDYLWEDGAISEAIFSINDVRDPIVMAIDEDMDYYTWMRRVQRWRTDINGNRYKEFVLGNPLPVPPNPESYDFIPDFSPMRGIRTNNYQLDRDWVLDNIVQPYIDRLPLKPIEMAQRSINLFERVLSANEEELCSPPLSVGEIGRLKGWIEQLRRYIENLEGTR